MSNEEFKNNITIYLMEHKFGKIDSKEVLEAITYEAQSYADQQLKKRLAEVTDEIKIILKGIDKDDTDTENGWWETSTGVEFGVGRLKAILNLLKKK